MDRAAAADDMSLLQGERSGRSGRRAPPLAVVELVTVVAVLAAFGSTRLTTSKVVGELELFELAFPQANQNLNINTASCKFTKTKSYN